MSKDISTKSYETTKQLLFWLGAHRVYVGKVFTGLLLVVGQLVAIALLIAGFIVGFVEDDMIWVAYLSVPGIGLVIILIVWIIIDYVKLKGGTFTDGQGKIIKRRGEAN